MIPKGFVDKYLPQGEGTTFYGVPLKELSRDELIACVIRGWEAEQSTIKESARQRKFLLSLRRG